MSHISQSWRARVVNSVLQWSAEVTSAYGLLAMATDVNASLIGRNAYLANVTVLILRAAEKVLGCTVINAGLCVAAFRGHTDVVCALVSAGADVNYQHSDGFSPLSMASLKGHIDCVKLLIHGGAEVEARNNQGATPLHRAAKNGHTEVVEFLIEQHADVNACLNDGSSCLWEAAFHGHTDVVRALVSAGADVCLLYTSPSPRDS